MTTIDRDSSLFSSRQDASETLEFLASSWNRLDVLDALAIEPRTRADLRDLTAVSRVTLSRILSDLEAREWITRHNDQYEATPHGVFVAAEAARVLDNLQTASDLGSIMAWVPIARFDFDLAHLRDARVITPTYDNFTAQSQRLIDLVYESDRIRGIGTGLDHDFMGALWDASVNGDLELSVILRDDLFDSIAADPDLRRQFSDMAAADTAQLYRYDGDEPLTMLGIHDGVASQEDVVMLCGQHEAGAPPGTVESSNPVVRDWAESYFASIRAAARVVEPAMLTQ